MSRVAKTLKNAKIGVLFYVITIFANFFSRKIFLQYLGDDFIGLTSTLQSILGFLNLAELGIGTAIGFTLYKPIFEKNYELINRILALFGNLYKKVGLITLIIGIIISLFFTQIFKDVDFSYSIIYFVFYCYLSSTLLGYFYNYHLILLEADQKGYVVTQYYKSFTLLRLILQSVVLLYFKNYFLWVSIELAFAIIYSITLRKKIQKIYPWLNLNYKSNKSILKEFPGVIKKIKQIVVHKIGGFVLNGTDQLLIFAFVNLESVAFFGNYQLIFMNLLGLLNNLFAGTAAGIGNVVAENNKNTIKKVFWEMMSLRYFIAGAICVSLFYLTEPFIVLWLGEKYILNKAVFIVMLLNLFIMQIRGPVDNFKQAYGLYDDTWAPIAQSIINLVISVVLGYKYGILGIMIGSLVSLLLIIIIWKPYYLYKKGFKINSKVYWGGFFKLFLSFSISFTCFHYIKTNYINFRFNNYLEWLYSAILIVIVFSVIYFSVLYALNKGFKDIVLRAKTLILKKYKNGKK
jgi:O-antigen/teichoic acid export membrane protein